MNNRGFTLIELLVAVAVGALVLLGIGGFYLSTVRFYGQSNSQAFLQRQASLIIEEMARQIHAACELTDNPGLLCVGCPPPSLSVTQPGVAKCDGPTYSFYQSGNQLFERHPNKSDFNLLSGSPVLLTVISFTTELLPSKTTARVTFELKDNVSNSMKFETALSRRN
jgi:prepilin-type N-terminal cleavage/methylation domain-containing protein